MPRQITSLTAEGITIGGVAFRFDTDVYAGAGGEVSRAAIVDLAVPDACPSPERVLIVGEPS